MATPRNICLEATSSPEFSIGDITQEQADLTSSLLQQNHEKHHMFFNEAGYHNHIVHHLLSIYALNAPLGDVQQAFDVNKTYQRPVKVYDEDTVRSMNEPQSLLRLLGDERQYENFLEFFTRQTEASGLEQVINKYIFAKVEVAESMLARLFLPFLHGVIHLGFGVEFRQPAIVCEALAQVACHEDWMGSLLKPAEEAGKEHTWICKSFIDLLDEIQRDEKLRDAPQWTDPNKLRDGIIVRAPERMTHHLAQVRIDSSKLDEKVAEMTNLVAYFAAGAQNPPHEVMYDFTFMHCMNASIFLSTFIKQSWLSDYNKVRMLEWKVRADLAIYASRRAPELHLDEICKYKPVYPADWDAVIARACRIPDDGHASKLVRALAHGAKICAPYHGKKGFIFEIRDWLQMAHMAVDSTEKLQKNGERWIRSAGFSEAWIDVPKRG